MPKFGLAAIGQHKLDSLARYSQYTRAPQDKGGWGIGHIGPVPEGFVAWLIGLGALILSPIRRAARISAPSPISHATKPPGTRPTCPIPHPPLSRGARGDWV